MSAPHTESVFTTPEDVFELYGNENEQVPNLTALSPDAAVLANRLLRQSGYVDVAGYSPADTGLTIGQVIGLRSLHDQDHGSESHRGPYVIFGDTESPEYIPGGVAIWVPRSTIEVA